jgi:hypothetical protein
MKTYAMNWAPPGALAVLLCTASAETERHSLQHHEIEVEKELLITATEVVDSPQAEYPGAWSFGHLLEEAYGEENGARVVAEWLHHWSMGQKASRGREALPERPGLVEHLVRPWQEADGFDPESGERWIPDLSNAPFRLLAIVNRIDLAFPISSTRQELNSSSFSPYASSGSFFADVGGGEARFVFAATDQEGKALKPGTTIIFEYGLDVLKRKQHLLEWAAAWHGLGTYEEFEGFYLHDLEELTRAFTDRRPTEKNAPDLNLFGGPSDKDLAERSALRQGKSLSGRLGTGNGAQHTQLLRIRTNDGSFGRKREFREFERQRTRLVAAPLPGTPRDRFFHSDTDANRWLTDWVKRQDRLRSKAMTIRDQVSEEVQLVFRVPERGTTSRGTGPVVAMVSPVHGDASFHWNGKGVDPHLRHAFSSQSCCGCHCGDTNTEFSTSPHASAESGPSSRSSCAPMVPGSRLRIQPATSTSRPLEIETRAKVLKMLLNQELDQYQGAEILGDP